jgi:hypothetical protein
MAWDYYNDANLSEILAMAADLMLAGLENTVYDGDDVAAIIALSDSLTVEEKNAFFVIAAHNTYYNALEAYFNSKTPEADKDSEIATAILNAHIYNVAREIGKTEADTEAFLQCMLVAIETYEALNDKENLPEALSDIYNSCLEIYNELK